MLEPRNSFWSCRVRQLQNKLFSQFPNQQSKATTNNNNNNNNTTMKLTNALTVFSTLILGISGERILRGGGGGGGDGRGGGGDRPPPPPQDPPSPPELPVGDLNIRFNKITFVDGEAPPGINPLPMEFDDYPLDRETAEWLRQTQAVSVIRYRDCGECDIPTHELIAEVGGGPTHPSTDTSDPYWEELWEVVQVQQARLRGDDPTMVMPLPDIWDGYDIHDVADAVHDEVSLCFSAPIQQLQTTIHILTVASPSHFVCCTVSGCSSHYSVGSVVGGWGKDG